MIKLAVLTFILAAALVDTAVGAGLGGFFAMFNTVLLTLLTRRSRHVEQRQLALQRLLSAPRKLVFDQEGRAVGTVIKLDDEDWFYEATHRRHDDPPASELP